MLAQLPFRAGRFSIRSWQSWWRSILSWTGVGIVRRSVSGLMDSALPAAEVAQVGQILEHHLKPGVEIHALRTRQSASVKFISMHVLVPGNWTVEKGHQLVTQIET